MFFRTAISLLASQFAKRPALRESATNDCQYQTWVSKVHRTTHQKTRPKTKDQAPCGSSIRERSTHQQCTVMVPWQNANHYASKHTKGFVPKVGANRLQHVICRKAMCCNIRIALHCLNLYVLFNNMYVYGSGKTLKINLSHHHNCQHK